MTGYGKEILICIPTGCPWSFVLHRIKSLYEYVEDWACKGENKKEMQRRRLQTQVIFLGGERRKVGMILRYKVLYG